MIPFISFIDLSAINELLRQTTKTFANKISLALLGNKRFYGICAPSKNIWWLIILMCSARGGSS